MDNNKPKQVSERLITGVMLAFTGGYLDAYTYVCRGHVFANAQTGNMVLMGINFAEGKWLDGLSYIIPIAAFFIGILVAERIRLRYKENDKIHWRQIIIAVETAVLAAAAFIPTGRMNMAVNTAVSFVCSLQVQSFRKVNGNAYATTMCTGNLRSAAEQLSSYRQTKDKKSLHNSLQYIGIILFFIAGASIGSILTNDFSSYSVLVCCGLLITVFGMMAHKDE